MAGDEGLAAEYIKAHASRVGEIMTRNVITAAPDTPLHRIAEMLEKYGIKRLPIVRDCQRVGIVSRANLVQAIATSGSKLDIPLTHLSESKLGAHVPLNATVDGGVVDLWGFVESDTEKSYSCRRRSNAGRASRERSHDSPAMNGTPYGLRSLVLIRNEIGQMRIGRH